MFKLIEDPQNKKVMMANAKLPNHISKGIRKGAYISGKALVAELRSDMNRSKSGKTYMVSTGIGGKSLKRPRLHRASSSSEAPAVISGEFRSWKIK